ncbi:methyltransferase [Actinomyces slackii]|uniref:Ribosomal RNA small subunit methyltransferase C n=1 Tax=Actinomyces slackii TaxID=52774 RepID=A0A3S4SJG7_9ACTO|nr:methyltransferase [Actinomyces slackii]VEG74125.1 Ribosomal RNA small subunit methyltransferase C [Actinomyces slackii]
MSESSAQPPQSPPSAQPVQPVQPVQLAPPASPPPPVLSPERARDLRKDLEASGWGVDAVAHLLGPAAQAALEREILAPARRAIRSALDEDRAAGASPSPVALLTALFMLGQAIAATELDAVWPRTRSRGAAAIGLITEPDSRGLVRARVDLRPHEAADDSGPVRWWVASDLGELVTGRALAPDHVLGIGGAGLTLAGLTPRRPVASALDLGCGCGIQSLYLLRHAERVTATDLSERALAFTAFNAALAGDADRLELLAGSLLEPVAGRRFDLIATNPPFVLTPTAVREAGLPLMEYRDAGGPILPGLLAGLGDHLEPGGIAVALGNWEHRRGSHWRQEVESWLPAGADAWVVQREVQDPVAYAALWLRDGGLAPERDPEGFDAALEAWAGDFEDRGVEALGMGYLIVAMPDSPRQPWRVLEEVTTSGTGALGAHVAEVVEAQGLVVGLDEESLSALHPVRSADVTEERHYIPGQSEPTVILLRQGGGLGRALVASTTMSALAGVADGELSLSQIATALAALSGLEGREALELRAQVLAEARELARCGLLSLRRPS